MGRIGSTPLALGDTGSTDRSAISRRRRRSRRSATPRSGSAPVTLIALSSRRRRLVASACASLSVSSSIVVLHRPVLGRTNEGNVQHLPDLSVCAAA